MRLRYLNLRDAPPLQQLAIPFLQEAILAESFPPWCVGNEKGDLCTGREVAFHRR